MPDPAAVHRKPRVVVVLPAYNAARTLQRTIDDIPPGIADEIVLVDDGSRDDTVAVARSLGLRVVVHPANRGYGGNQKTCYRTALEMGADIVVMLHPDYQYDPTVVPELVAPIASGKADAVFASRVMQGGALEGRMPPWKYKTNLLLTALANVVLDVYLTEYHSGFRAYSRKVLETCRLEANSDNFIFDTEIIVQCAAQRFRIHEVPIHARYFPEASTIPFTAACRYGLGILWTLCKYRLHRAGWARFAMFEPQGAPPAPPVAR